LWDHSRGLQQVGHFVHHPALFLFRQGRLQSLVQALQRFLRTLLVCDFSRQETNFKLATWKNQDMPMPGRAVEIGFAGDVSLNGSIDEQNLFQQALNGWTESGSYFGNRPADIVVSVD